jgi:hypothetical protein
VGNAERLAGLPAERFGDDRVGSNRKGGAMLLGRAQWQDEERALLLESLDPRPCHVIQGGHAAASS